MIIQESLQTEVKYNCDVLVCGGGVAGIAAALSAARCGKSVILTERMFLLGGLATAGLVTIYLPLCDGYGHQVSFGIAEELLQLSVKDYLDGKRGADWLSEGGKDRQNEHTHRFEVNFNPQLFAIHAEQLLEREGVKILYGTTAASAFRDGDRLTAVIFENKSGRFAVAAKSFIDATGDADLAMFSDTPTQLHGKGNILAAWYYSNRGDEYYDRHMMGYSEIPDEEIKKGTKATTPLINRHFQGVDGEEVSEMTTLSHLQILADVQKKRQEDDRYLPTTVATIPQLRMTRRVVGEYTLDISEEHKRFDDSVGLVSNWHRRGPVYEVPFGTLYSKETVNLLFAGRVTSCTDPMWDIMRVIPCCAVTGEAAGLAASMTDDMTALDIERLQNELRRRGVVIHESEL